jgi:hypothetical protein
MIASTSLRRFCLSLSVLLAAVPMLAKDAPLQTIDWPTTGTPVIRFSFGKFKSIGMSDLHHYVLDTTATNLSAKRIPAAQFTVYCFDKKNVRIGEEVLAVNDIGPGETIKLETHFEASGTPVSLSIQNASQASFEDTAHAPKTVSLTVNSTPQGVMLKVDGTEVGMTPRLINVGIGKHILTFTKEGFSAGNFPLEITRNDVSGGSINYELGSSAFDSIELRDGSVMNGDLVSVSGMDVEIRVGGSIQHVDRNKIKQVLLVQRDTPIADLPPSAPKPNP